MASSARESLTDSALLLVTGIYQHFLARKRDAKKTCYQEEKDTPAVGPDREGTRFVDRAAQVTRRHTSHLHRHRRSPHLLPYPPPTVPCIKTIAWSVVATQPLEQRAAVAQDPSTVLHRCITFIAQDPLVALSFLGLPKRIASDTPEYLQSLRPLPPTGSARVA